MEGKRSIRQDIKEYESRHDDTNDFYTSDLQDIVDLSAHNAENGDQLFYIIVTALKAGYARGYAQAEADISA